MAESKNTTSIVNEIARSDLNLVVNSGDLPASALILTKFESGHSNAVKFPETAVLQVR